MTRRYDERYNMEWPAIFETDKAEIANAAAESGVYCQARYDTDRHVYVFVKRAPKKDKE